MSTKSFSQAFGAVFIVSFLAFPHPPFPLFFLPLSSSECDRCLEWGLMARSGDLPAMGVVFYLGAGWPQWKAPLILAG